MSKRRNVPVVLAPCAALPNMSARSIRAQEIPPPKLLRAAFAGGRLISIAMMVRKLIDAARHIAPSHPIKGPSLSTLFGLLAATGMRVSEALALECKDVDLDQELLTIHLAKGNKSRLVPLHASTVAGAPTVRLHSGQHLSATQAPRVLPLGGGRSDVL